MSPRHEFIVFIIYLKALKDSHYWGYAIKRFKVRNYKHLMKKA